MSKENIVGETVVGDTYLSEEQTLKWEVRNFATLDQKHKEEFGLPPMQCHGHLWKLYIYPRGDNDTEKDEEWVSIYLKLHRVNKTMCPTGAVKVTYKLSAGKKIGLAGSRSFDEEEAWGCHQFIQRNELLDPTKKHLENGSLILKATIQMYIDRPKFWSPKNRLGNDMLQLLESGEKSDVSFLVDGRKFHVHSPILTIRAPVLADLVEHNSKSKEVAIDNVDKAVFQSLLRYVYAEALPKQKEIKKIARELLEAADRFGCTSLKLLAEAEIAKSGIKASDAANILLDADAGNCALLKEEALNVIAASPNTAMSSPGWANLEKSAALMAEVVKVIVSKPCWTGGSDYGNMDVSTLRRKLDEAGMGVDGTKDMLIERLKSKHG